MKKEISITLVATMASLCLSALAQDATRKETPAKDTPPAKVEVPKSTAKTEEYKETDLPFQAELALAKGGDISEQAVKEGDKLVLKPTASGVTITALSLGEKVIPLESTNVTADAMIVTKDYGKLRVKMNYATFSFKILVTPKQEEALRKLLSKNQ